MENQNYFRVSRLEEHNLDTGVEDQVIADLERLAPIAHGIVISDFVYGVVTPGSWNVFKDCPGSTTYCCSAIFSAQPGGINNSLCRFLSSVRTREARLFCQDKDSGLEQLELAPTADHAQ